jgi:ribulose kinase
MAMESAETTHVIGVDGGTEGVRVGVFTVSGAEVGTARVAYGTQHPRVGWAEQWPEEWWSALVGATREAVRRSGVPVASICGIAVAATCSTVVATDKDGRPLRPAILWMDMRAAREAREIAACGDPALKVTGYTAASAEWLPCKALWLLRNEPETFRDAVHLVEYGDWLGFRLTGEWTASINSATIRAYYDRAAGGWPVSLYDAVGMAGLERKLCERVLDLGAPIGRLRNDVADELGLPRGIPVGEGGADAFVAMIGLGVTRPGRLALITGSSHLHLMQTSTAKYRRGVFGAYTDAVIPGQYTLEGGQTSTGSVIRWYERLLSSGNPDAGIDLDALFRRAGDLPPGAEGLLALEYWQGNRTPHVDADARGLLWGFSLHHGPEHVLRALLEAICYGTDLIFEELRAAAGQDIGEVVACGGALTNPLWPQLHADVSGVAITVPENQEATLLGAAALAAVAAGAYATPDAAGAAMFREARRVVPREGSTEAYAFYREQYANSYRAMSDLMHAVAAHEARTPAPAGAEL